MVQIANVSGLRPWRTLDSSVVYVAAPWIRVLRLKVELPDGSVVDDFHRIDLGTHTAVVAETDDGRLVLVRQYRHGPGRVCLGLPAGMVSAGESPRTAAARELLEETGYVAQGWCSLGTFTESGNYGCSTMHCFRAEQARRIAEPQQSALEYVEVTLLSPEEVVTAMRNGEIPLIATVGVVALALAWEGRATPEESRP